MSQTEFRKYILSSEFKELLKRYEDSRATGGHEFFDVDDLIDIAEYYNIQKDLTRTIETAEYCKQLYPDDQMATYMLARLSLSEYKDADRAEAYLAGIDNYRDPMEATLLKAEIQLVRGNADAATGMLRKGYSELRSNVSDNAATCYDSMADEDEADYTKDSLEAYPLDSAMLLCDYEQFICAEEWMKLLKAPPEEMVFEYWETWGRIFHATGRPKEAVDAFNLAIDDDAYSVITWIQLCDAQYQLAQTDDVLQSAEYILALAPDNEDGLAYKGYCMMEKARFDEAMECFDKLEKQFPGNIRPLIFKAAIILKQGNIQLAHERMLEALDGTTWDIPTVNDIATLLSEIGFKDATYLLLTTIFNYDIIKTYKGEALQRTLELLADCCNELGNH